MNKISKLSKISNNVIMGINNVIHDNVIIYDDVIIGNNNQIYENTIIYPNVTIGDNNIILNNNIIGETGVEAKYEFYSKKFNGLSIGNNNLIHVKNIIFNGYHNKTIIGNNNKLLAEIHVGHDTTITEHVHIYPRCITGGLSTLLPNSGVGLNTVIHQKCVVGSYAFVGMMNACVKNVFPFLININNKSTRMNYSRVPNEFHIYEKELMELYKMLCNKENIVNTELFNMLPKEVRDILNNYLVTITTNKK